MQFKLTVQSDRVEVKSGNAKATGKPYSMREQKGIVTLPNGDVRSCALLLESDEAPLALGDYDPKESAFQFNKYGEPSISMRAKHWQRVVQAEISKPKAVAA